MELTEVVIKCYQKLLRLGTKSDADAILLYAYLLLWNRTGSPVHVNHFHDDVVNEDVFIARFSDSKQEETE
ncbi:hypothetical protein [Lactiplantibacillus xiangfangensis]|uniref:hypothetical protein n=1 Tax=Lactiplantibacillus xiangfangensis TaxID=942150 RepID=UPI00070C4F9E|nr:hypothetical protein [Lactiplantibacillus xiangfangensis]